MMAMTPYEKKTLEDIECAFLETVEPQFAPVAVAKKRSASAPRRGWFAGMKERLVLKFVCCAPPQALLDDDEIHEILAKIEEPAKPTKPTALQRTPSRKEQLLRRNSASVMPVSLVGEPAVVHGKPAALSDITHVLSDAGLVEIAAFIDTADIPSADLTIFAPPPPLRSHAKLAAIQLAVISLLTLQKLVQTRQTERAVLAVQLKWRRRHAIAATAAEPAPTVTAPAAPTTPTSEPDIEPKNAATAVSSPKRRRHRVRKHRGRNKSKFGVIADAATEETAEAVDSLTQLALTRKRLRSVDLESRSPRVDVERNVHVMFGEEEIDNSDDDELDLGLVSPPRGLTELVQHFSMQRCASVPPPSTAFRPRPVKTKALAEAQAATKIQNAYRSYRARQEREIRRRLQQYEAEKQSVMPTIRSKMAQLRRRLEEMQERNSSDALVALPEATALVAPVDDDFDWL